nr:mechanosensitive ion channel family protein [Halapricum sp. CBA1109]
MLGAWGATVFVERVISVVAAENDALTRHQQEVGYNVAKVGLYLLAVVAAVAAWGIKIGDVLLGAGFLSVVLGLAARQTLASVLAGFILLFGRPFDIGDWIVVDDQEGVITDVSIFNTELRTVNGEFVVIPNDVVTNTSLVNRSRRGRLRVDVEVGVDYDTDLDRARELATEAVADRAGDVIQEVPEPKTVLVRFGDSAVVLETRFWIDDPSAERRWEAQTQAVTAIRQAFEAAEITIPFPQRTLNQRLSEDPEDER